MEVVREFAKRQNYDYLHGGTYHDRVQGVSRQFDIRATASDHIEPSRTDVTYRLTVECKNIGENYPLLVQCVPRPTEDAFHDFAAVMEGATKTYRAPSDGCAYFPGEHVGKDLMQVGRAPDKG
jgi:hypothetical protein